MSPLIKWLLILLPILLFSSCSSIQSRKSAALSKAVYSTQAAIRSGRFELAKSYSEEATRLVAPPKKVIQVKPVETQGKRYVTLPVELSGFPVLSFETPSGQELLKEDPKLKKQVEEEKAAVAKLDKSETKVLKDEAKAAAKPKSFLSWFTKLLIFSPLVLVIGLVAVCIFFPALLPLILSVLGTLRRLLNSGLSFIGGLFK